MNSKMAKFCNQFYSKLLVSDPVAYIRDLRGGLRIVQEQVQFQQARRYSVKKGDEEGPSITHKKESMEPIEMPGMVSPEKLNEHEYFSKVEKRRIEDLKKIAKPGQPVVKKDED